jgi:hypothetical protein
MTCPAQLPKSSRQILREIFMGIIAAGALALAPAPAFAQHSGGHSGGGGGHSSTGGGGHASSGGGHSSGGGGGHVSTGGGSHVAPGPAHMMSGGAHVSTPSSAGMGMRASGNSFVAPAPAHFTGGNMSWQAPPPSRVSIPSNSWRPAVPNIPSRSNAVASLAMTRPRAPLGNIRDAESAPVSPVGMNTVRSIPPIGMVPTPVHVFGGFRHRRFFNGGHGFFFGGGCFNGFFPGFCGFGNNFFWGSSFWGCDPFWGWGCNGFGYNGNYGYAPAVNYSDSNVAASQENGPFSWQNPSENAEPSATAEPSVTLLYLSDGSSYAVTDYWIAEGRLNYLTTYGGENSIALDQLDWQRTVDENAARGVPFTLRPSPAPVSPQ